MPEQDREAYLCRSDEAGCMGCRKYPCGQGLQPGRFSITPEGVWKARTADAHSRDIFFVSMARSMGIPARIDEVTGKVQLMGDEGAVDVNFEGDGTGQCAYRQKFIARYTPIKSLADRSIILISLFPD